MRGLIKPPLPCLTWQCRDDAVWHSQCGVLGEDALVFLPEMSLHMSSSRSTSFPGFPLPFFFFWDLRHTYVMSNCERLTVAQKSCIFCVHSFVKSVLAFVRGIVLLQSLISPPFVDSPSLPHFMWQHRYKAGWCRGPCSQHLCLPLTACGRVRSRKAGRIGCPCFLGLH